MLNERFDLRGLDDRQLLDGLLKLHQTSAEVMADLLCHLAEVERRGLYLKRATASLFKYAVVVLGCTEDEAWRRVTAAQTAARFPTIFERVARGELTLTAVYLLRKVLTDENHREVLAEAAHKTREQLEELRARLAPQPDVMTRLVAVSGRPRPRRDAKAEASRAVPPAGRETSTLALNLTAASTAPAAVAVASAAPTEPVSGASATTPTEPTRPEPTRCHSASVVPLSPTSWKLTLTIGTEARRALHTARDLTPFGDEARIIERALIEYAEKVEVRKYAKLKGRKRKTASETTTLSSTGPANEPLSEASTEAQAPAGAATATASATSAKAPASAGPTAAAPFVEAVIAGASIGTAAPPGPLPAFVPARVRGTRATPGRAPDRKRRPHNRRAIVRAVIERDGAQCSYVDPETGRRCCETANLELHHVIAYARGGASDLTNYRLRCRAHNAYQALLDFGAEHIARSIARRRSGS